VVVPVQRSKNLRMYAMSPRCTDENLISTVTLHEPPSVQDVLDEGSAHWPLEQNTTPVIGAAAAGA